MNNNKSILMEEWKIMCAMKTGKISPASAADLCSVKAESYSKTSITDES